MTSLSPASTVFDTNRYQAASDRLAAAFRKCVEGVFSELRVEQGSRKFGVASDQGNAATGAQRPHEDAPSTPKRSDWVPFVAASCSKGLRLVTTQLPEISPPIGPGQTNFGFTEF